MRLISTLTALLTSRIVGLRQKYNVVLRTSVTFQQVMVYSAGSIMDPTPAKGGYRIIIASNRDEFYRRPAKGAYHIKETGLIGGRDMEPDREDGMWLGITVNPLANIKLRFGALLNVTGEERKSGVEGRGPIVKNYLIGSDVATSYNHKLQNTDKIYNAFNFVSIELSADDLKTYHHSNAPYDTKVYDGKQLLGFGNSTTEHPLQKVVMGRKRFADIIKDANDVNKQEELCNNLLQLLKWEEKHLPDKELEKRAPNTVEQLSQVFVKFPEAGYGTRTHSIILVDDEWNVEFLESTMKEPIDPSNPIWDTVKIKSRL